MTQLQASPGGSPGEASTAHRPESVVDRHLRLRRPNEPQIAPDGERIAFVVADVAKPDDGRMRSVIWTGRVGGEPNPLTDPEASSGLPRWSPDGTHLAWASDEGTGRARTSLLVAANDAPPARLANLPGPIDDLQWESNDSLLALVTDPEAESLSMDGAVKPDAGADPRVLVPGSSRTLWRVLVPSGDLQQVGPDGWAIWEFAPVGHGRVVGVASEDPSENGWYRAVVALVDLATGRVDVLHRPEWQIASPTASPDGAAVAVIEAWSSDRGLVQGECRVIRLGDRSVRTIALEDADIAFLRWRDPSSIWFAGVRGLQSTFGWLDLENGNHVIHDEQATMRSRYQAEIAPAPGSDIVAAVVDRVEQPYEVQWRHIGAGDDGWHPVTSLNAAWDESSRRTTRRLTWRGADGLELEGLLVEPVVTEPGRRPLVINARGGPCWPFRHGTLPLQVSAAVEAGFRVLLPNPRGTPGRGQDFARANIPTPGVGEVDDMVRAVDTLASDGLVDPDRVAIMGGSWAGYLTAWAVATRSDRFRCGIMMYGISNLVSCHRSCNNAAFYEYILQARPEGVDAIAKYMEYSPITYVHTSQTPTLILHGEHDLCTPLGQGVELYQGLADAGVETQLVIYPREGHAAGNWERAHQADLAARVTDWLGRHLGDPRA
jgi:dipeptidyl aminopeptidase/acylaminoacyl peptidase